MKKKQSKEWVTINEYNRIINNPYIPRREELIISILYGCALRVGELAKLKVRDIKIETSTITIWESKRTKDTALVPVPAPVLKLIVQWITENKLRKNRHLLFSIRDKKLALSQIHRIIKIAAKRAGIEKDLTCHSFRRGRATHLLDAGLPLEKVSKLLRHKDLGTTMIYLKISIKDLQIAIERIDNSGNKLPY
jgi:integrase/recombinase XerD